MLAVRNLFKRYGQVEAVRGVSFEVVRGETFGLLGPNGAGKSTTLHMICGLVEPSEGEVLVNGMNIRREPRSVKELLGWVPQEIALYPTLTGRENLNFWGGMYGLAGRELALRVDEALDTVGLREWQRSRVETYSGGMKRRLNIAASLLHHPALLIMDEPTVGIDPQSRNHILETIRRLNQELGMTVVYTSHYMEEVEYLCRRLVILDHGSVLASGTLDEVRAIAGQESTLRLKVTFPDEELVAALSGMAGVGAARREHDTILIQVRDSVESIGPILATINAQGNRLVGMELQNANLETVFLRLTGRALRD